MQRENIHINRETNTLLAEKLYEAYTSKSRVRLYYGDVRTGEDELRLHGIEGVLTSSTGSQPVFKLETDIGLMSVETEKVVKLKVDDKVVYIHPFYHVPTLEIVPLANSLITVKSGEKVIASGVSFERARYICSFLTN